MELLLIGFVIGAPIGLAGGLHLHRSQLDRARETISYAAKELERRKQGALKADLRSRQGLP